MSRREEEIDELMERARVCGHGQAHSRAVIELAELKKDKQDAMASMQEGIVAQEKEVARLANIIRSGQRELLAAPPPIPPAPKGKPDGKSAAAGAGAAN